MHEGRRTLGKEKTMRAIGNLLWFVLGGWDMNGACMVHCRPAEHRGGGLPLEAHIGRHRFFVKFGGLLLKTREVN
jgi:hypothetical protein